MRLCAGTTVVSRVSFLQSFAAADATCIFGGRLLGTCAIIACLAIETCPTADAVQIRLWN
jgi:hypothetical protein